MKDNCECIMHRYHVFHITPEGDVFSHSQNSWDWARINDKTDNIVTVPIAEYHHGITRQETKALYAKYARAALA